MIANFKKKKNSNIFLNFLLQCGVILIVFLVVFLIVSDVRIYQKKRELDAQIESVKNKIADLNEKTANLRQGMSNADEQHYIEQVAREELDLQKPGEKVVSFIASQHEQVKKDGDQGGLFQSWLAWLAGVFKKQ